MKLTARFLKTVIFFLILCSYFAFSEEVPSVNLNENTEEGALIKRAILASEACYHWAGEVGDQTPARNKEIEEGVKRDCPPAKKLMENAFAKYPKNSALYEHVLYLYDSGHMKLTTEELKKLCSSVKNGAGC